MATVEPGEWRCIGCGRAYTDRAPGALCEHDDRVLVPAATAERFGGDALLGRRLADDYLIFDILGLGGFGAVYRAIDTAHDGRQVAIKTIRPGAERHNADARARFTQEARLLERLRDPHIVEVYRYGEADDALFMALELVPGRSLKRVLRSKSRLSPRRAVYITSQILSALTHAHALGLVHRDLKPANILVVEHENDRVKVIDFGIAKVLEAEDDDEGPKTGTGLVLGTVRYMAPEQLRQGGQVGSPTDLYAVGIMFYEMIAGRAPFDGSQAEIAAAHLYQPAPALDEALAPATLRAWLARVLLKHPEQRFADAAEMRAALLEALPIAVDDGPGEVAPIESVLIDERPSGSMDGISGPSEGAVRIIAEAMRSASSGSVRAAPADGAPAGTSTGEAQDEPAGDGRQPDEQRPDAQQPDAQQPDEQQPGGTLPDGALTVEPAPDGATVESPLVSSVVIDSEAPDPGDITLSEAEMQRLREDARIPAATERTPAVDPELAALPNLDPGGPRTAEAEPAWGDIDVGHAPTVLRETSGTIQAARGELGLVDDLPGERRRWWWLAPVGVVGAALLLWVLVPWSGEGGGADSGPVERIRLSVGNHPSDPPPVVPPIPDVSPPADAAPDAAPPDAEPAQPKARKRSEMHWRQVQRLEQGITDALDACRCSQARGLHRDLPREFPRDRRRRLDRRINRCKVPLVDQQCVDGEVR